MFEPSAMKVGRPGLGPGAKPGLWWAALAGCLTLILPVLGGCPGGRDGSEVPVYRIFRAPVAEARATVGADGSVVVRASGVFSEECSSVHDAMVTLSRDSLGLSVRGRTRVPACKRAEVGFVSLSKIVGLEVGRYRIRINESTDLYVAVGKKGSGQGCTDGEARIDSLAVPAIVPAGAPTRLSFKASFPDLCWEEQAGTVRLAGSDLLLNVPGRRCSLQGAPCPPVRREFSSSVLATVVPAGKYRLMANGREVGALEAVPGEECTERAARVSTVQVREVPVAGGENALWVSGTMSGPCMSLLDPTIRLSRDNVVITLNERACKATCPGPEVTFRVLVPLPALASGSYTLEVNGTTMPLVVLRPEACQTIRLPGQRISLAQGGETPATAEAPLDVTVSGTMPSACDRFEGFETSRAGQELRIYPLVRRCGLSCPAAARPYVGSVSFLGLPAGTYTVAVPGLAGATIELKGR